MKKAGKLVTGLLGLAMAAVTVLPAMVEKQVIHLEPNYCGHLWQWFPINQRIKGRWHGAKMYIQMTDQQTR